MQFDGTKDSLIPSTATQEDLYPALTYELIGIAMAVHGKLGGGFLEKVYENAMMVILRRRGFEARQQAPIPVLFEGEIVGEYVADILVESKVILEIKAARALVDEHRAQLINYLKATQIRVGLLLNFGARLAYERFVN